MENDDFRFEGRDYKTIGKIEPNGKNRPSFFNGHFATPVVVNGEEYEVFRDWSARKVDYGTTLA